MRHAYQRTDTGKKIKSNKRKGKETKKKRVYTCIYAHQHETQAHNYIQPLRHPEKHNDKQADVTHTRAVTTVMEKEKKRKEKKNT